jgi:hypothetical protein
MDGVEVAGLAADGTEGAPLLAVGDFKVDSLMAAGNSNAESLTAAAGWVNMLATGMEEVVMGEAERIAGGLEAVGTEAVKAVAGWVATVVVALELMGSEKAAEVAAEKVAMEPIQ